MKTIYLLIFIYSIFGCSEHIEKENLQECGYIDYQTCSKESITPEDKFLLNHVDFREGKLILSLNDEAIAKQGISKQKYAYFLKYLQNRNREIEADLDVGKIIIYNGIPFTKNKELYQYIEISDKVQSKATEYETSQLLFNDIIRSGQSVSHSFIGPSKLSISLSGRGTFTVTGIDNIHPMKGAILKKGVGNYVHWNLGIAFSGSDFTETGTALTYGHYEKKAPQPSLDPKENLLCINWHNNLPPYISVERVSYGRIRIIVKNSSSFTVFIYRKPRRGKEYFPYMTWERFNGMSYIDMEESYAYWVGFYEEIKSGNRVYLQYVGDREIHPSFWDGHPYE